VKVPLYRGGTAAICPNKILIARSFKKSGRSKKMPDHSVRDRNPSLRFPANLTGFHKRSDAKPEDFPTRESGPDQGLLPKVLLTRFFLFFVGCNTRVSAKTNRHAGCVCPCMRMNRDFLPGMPDEYLKS